jgi:hypothetical protein
VADGFDPKTPCCVVLTKVGDSYNVMIDRVAFMRLMQSALVKSEWLELPCWNGDPEHDLGYCLVLNLDPAAVMGVTDRYISDEQRVSYHEAMMDYAKRKSEGTAR